jgi:glycosyltransferase involved in cell wall biosynthesis
MSRRTPVILFSTADWNSPYWTNKQHMAAHLAARGYEVLYVETVGIRRPRVTPRDLNRMWERLKRAFSTPRQVRPNLWLLAPLTMPAAQGLKATATFNAWQLRRKIIPWLRQRRGDQRPLVWTYHPYMLQAVESIAPVAIVYHCVDDIGAIPGTDQRAYHCAEGSLLERADHVFATSPLLYQRCATLALGRTHYFPNVTDIDHFASARHSGPIPDDIASIPRPRLLYMGVLSDFKIDLDLIERLVCRRSDWHWVFIGDEREGQASETIARLRTRGNVHMLGWRPYSLLPEYLRGVDVALLPQVINDYTRAMFPMKFFEYLAAGRPLITTPLPALSEFFDLCRVATNADDMALAIETVLTSPDNAVVPVDHPVLRAHSWDRRLNAMLAIVFQEPQRAER